MISQNIPTPAKALAIGAHPDDIEFGAGATLAKWAANGCEVSLLICTAVSYTHLRAHET